MMAEPGDSGRGSGHERENENLKPSGPPRPATEPAGGEGSSRSSKTKTDPATGAPNPEAEA